MMSSPLTLITESFTEHPALDVGISHALLNAVSDGRIGPVFRLYHPQPVLAFGMADRLQPGYPDAVRVARAHGFHPIERLAGGRAAVFHESTLAFSWATPEPEPRAGITRRFEQISSLLNGAFHALGVESRIGEIPGEYCPGRYSINIGGTAKVMGVGQRLIRGAAHVGGVIVIDGSERIRDVLIPVYRALGADWDPRTAGAIADRAPHANVDNVTDAITDQLRQRFNVADGSVPEHIVDEAGLLTDNHIPKVA